MENNLVHCFENAESERLCSGPGQYSSEEIFRFSLPADEDAQQSGRRMRRFAVVARTGAAKLMLDLSEYFEIHVFTRAAQEYADPILDWFEGGNALFRSRGYGRDLDQQGAVLDIARLLGVSEMDRVLVLDSDEDSCPADQTANSVPVVSFRGDKNDTEFVSENYKRILIKASKLGDIRHGITEEFRQLIRNKRSGQVVSTNCMCGMHDCILMLLVSSHSPSTFALFLSIPSFSNHLQRETRNQRRRLLFDFNTLVNSLETAYSRARLPSCRTKRRSANDPSCSLSIRRINEVDEPTRKKSRLDTDMDDGTCDTVMEDDSVPPPLRMIPHTVTQDVSPVPPVYVPPLSSIQPCRLVHGKLLFPTPVVAIFLPQGGRF